MSKLWACAGSNLSTHSVLLLLQSPTGRGMALLQLPLNHCGIELSLEGCDFSHEVLYRHSSGGVRAPLLAQGHLLLQEQPVLLRDEASQMSNL